MGKGRKDNIKKFQNILLRRCLGALHEREEALMLDQDMAKQSKDIGHYEIGILLGL